MFNIFKVRRKINIFRFVYKQKKSHQVMTQNEQDCHFNLQHKNKPTMKTVFWPYVHLIANISFQEMNFKNSTSAAAIIKFAG